MIYIVHTHNNNETLSGWPYYGPGVDQYNIPTHGSDETCAMDEVRTAPK